MINTLDIFSEDVYHLQEYLGETEAQHRSETALYGDSWPGAQLQLEQLHRAERNAFWCLDALGVQEVRVVIEPLMLDADDIPF